MGVIPKNENKRDEITIILKDLQQYVPHDHSQKPISIAFGGDQLTCERARECQDLHKHPFDVNEQLGGFVLFSGD